MKEINKQQALSLIESGKAERISHPFALSTRACNSVFLVREEGVPSFKQKVLTFHNPNGGSSLAGEFEAFENLSALAEVC